MRHIPSHQQRPNRIAPARRGVTLSEVLVSTFIMSIGVVSLATLFPISLLRSVQATQYTNSTLLRNNLEALISFDPELIHDPDRDEDLLEHANTNYLIDPLGRIQALTPLALGTLPRFSGLLNNQQPSIAQMERSFMLPDTWQPVLTSRVESFRGSPNFDVTLPDTIDLSPYVSQMRTATTPGLPRYRMLLFDATGKSSVIKDLFAVNAGSFQLSWSDSAGPNARPLPGSFVPTLVKVEVQERRYTGMLTVRKEPNGVASVDAVTFFNRSFAAADEFIFSGNSGDPLSAVYSIDLQTGLALNDGFDGQPGIAGIDDNQDGSTDDAGERGWPGSDDRRTISLSWTVGTHPNPFLKNGAHLLDASSGQWYRIVNYIENTAAGTARLVVDRDLVPLPGTMIPQLVFYRGVLEVYPLGMRMAL